MTSPQKKSSPVAVVWIGVAVVVAVAGVIALAVDRGSNGGSDATTATATRTTAAGRCPTALGADSGAADALPRFEAPAGDPAICQRVPVVEGTDLDGDPITIGAGDGKGKVMVFVAHWCPHCQREVPLLKAHLDDDPLPAGVELQTVSTAVRPDAGNYPPEAWLERAGWPTPVLDDQNNKVADAYGLTSFPYFVVTDAQGQVLARTSGEISTDEFDRLVQAARTGKVVV